MLANAATKRTDLEELTKLELPEIKIQTEYESLFERGSLNKNLIKKGVELGKLSDKMEEEMGLQRKRDDLYGHSRKH